jgi:hypothetical protein
MTAGGFMGFIDKFGKGVKQVVMGMILGLVLLPLGVFCQYKAAFQMEYHKVFQSAKEVSTPADAVDGENIKTRGAVTYTGGSIPYEGETLRISEGDMFEGQFITYSIKRYNIVETETKTEIKDSDGNPTGKYEYTYTYNWNEIGTPQTSPSGIRVSINGLSADYNAVRQNYIPSATKHFQYSKGSSGGGSIAGRSQMLVKVDPGTYDKNSGKPFGSSDLENLYKKYGYSGTTSNLYVVELVGDIFKPDAQMTLAGKVNGSSIGVIEAKIGGGKMLALSYSDVPATQAELKATAGGEKLGKFIIGALCFMVGFSLLFGPIIKLLDFIPIVGDLAIGLIYFILFIVSAILSVFFYFLFELWFIWIGLAIVIPVLLIVLNAMKKKKA